MNQWAFTVAFNAGNLNEARNGITSHAEVMLERDSAAFSTCSGAPPRTAQRPAAAIAKRGVKL